ncbi:MAG: carbamoyltransferase HypF [Candidatus Melainabacteria bacterium RIFOXYA12_FULL_32_12]|nr:MAG: carbamoyltransferase HypF [Candidatus Melainabacteria bacterium RIFOXYA2_FULL_32_9]OGI24222.1 MAG: carbamoyltransferase HypF [Candidatus Melainabacteria bacterium RIFOXYA12_FULL_32_12]
MVRVRKSIKISGIIGSKAFISYVYSLVKKFGLSGWVKYCNEFIIMEVEGDNYSVIEFVSSICDNAKPMSKVVEFESHDVTVLNSNRFYIIESDSEFNYVEPVPQDTALCDDCVSKLFDSKSRKHNYPFIACNKCGPRYSVINSLPFTKENSSFGEFEYCYECQEDISKEMLDGDFSNCHACGPRIWLKDKNKVYLNQEESFKVAARIIDQQGIMLLKSINCFYLCSSAFSSEAVEKIREIKVRRDKPLTVMARNIQEVEKFAYVNDVEKELLTSKERPVVVLRIKNPDYLASNVASGFDRVGVMLPVNPIHYLLFDSGNFNVLLMSSANKSGQTIEIDNHKAESAFGELVDGILFHDLNIKNGSDDSIVTVANNKKYSFRLARGYAPNNRLLMDMDSCPVVLACGAHQNSTIALTTPDGRIHVSPYMGDLDTSNVFDLYKKNVILFCKLFNVSPEHAVCDLNPDYFSTRYVKTLKIPYSQMQHSYAHLISCLVDNDIAITTPVIGVIFDGSEYGADQTVWGGEFLVSRDLKYERAAYIPVFKMIGVKGKESQIYRLGYSLLQKAGIDISHPAYKNLELSQEEEYMFSSLMNKGVSSPLTSSAGKLFDAVAAIVGAARHSYYEEYSALYLESLADKNCEDIYLLKDYNIKNINSLIQFIAKDIELKEPVSKILGKFHNTLAKMVAHTCLEISKKKGIKQVALSGSVWMNVLLLERTVKELEKVGLMPLTHKNISTNDESLSIGQAAYLVHKIKRDKILDYKDKSNIITSEIF